MSKPTSMLMAALALVVLHHEARGETSPEPQAVQPPKQLSGSVQTGIYNALDLKAQSKLWLTRFTSPSMLLNYDVAFVYEREAFCAFTANLGQRSFHTSRFAIARKEGERYEVGDALQVKKVDFCAAAPGDALGYVVISKDYLGEPSPHFLINWAAGGAIKGLPALSDDADNAAPDPADAVASMELTAAGRTSTSKEVPPVLGLYAPTLEAEGVQVKFSSPSAPADAPKYCIKDLYTKKPVECFDTFSQATERIFASMRVTRKPAVARPQPAAHAEQKPARYELSVVDKN